MANYLVITEDKALGRVPRFVKARCTASGECIEVCPVNAVSGNPSKKQIFIDAKKFIKCGACVESCPSGAII